MLQGISGVYRLLSKLGNSELNCFNYLPWNRSYLVRAKNDTWAKISSNYSFIWALFLFLTTLKATACSPCSLNSFKFEVTTFIWFLFVELKIVANFITQSKKCRHYLLRISFGAELEPKMQSHINSNFYCLGIRFPMVINWRFGFFPLAR